MIFFINDENGRLEFVNGTKNAELLEEEKIITVAIILCKDFRYSSNH